MSDTTDIQQLTYRDVAARTGLTVDTLRTYKSTGYMPEADGYLDNRPWWWEETVERWMDERESE